MPSAVASWGRAIVTLSPAKRTSPPSGVWIPAIVFTRVDLPAPLSPTSATTSPSRTSKSTRSRAWTGPNLLLTPSTSSNGVLALIVFASPDLGDPRFFAGFGVGPRAEFVDRHFFVRNHGLLDVVFGDRDRFEQDRGHLA